MNNEEFHDRVASAAPSQKRHQKPFRLESHVTLASSDKYNDPYECEIFARKLRDRFAVSVAITHDPVTTRVYSNTWLFKDMATCWEKYHTIAGIVTDIRDFIEAEGLKSVVFQYMVKHSLSNISADFENIYETNIPNARQVIDKSTRGNLIKNMPTVPFRTQSGPDQLDAVYTSVGNAPNPVPLDNIEGESQLAIPQHQRKEMGLRDVIPSPISKFQEAAGITPSMFRGASSDKTIKTAAPDQDAARRKFIDDVKENAHAAIEFGKKLAMTHYMSMTGADEAEADAFYHGVKALCSMSKVVLNLSSSNLLMFMASNEYKPLTESPNLIVRFNHYALKRQQAEKALGCFGLSPIYASVTMLSQGDRGYGKCALRLEDVGDDAVLICGDSFRVRSPARPDYVANANLILYPFFAMADCKAASTIIAMGKHELAGGPAEALATIMNPTHEYGRCEALVFKPVTPKNVTEIVVASSDTAKTVRKILMRMGSMLPVVMNPMTPDIIYVPADKEMADDPAIKQAPQKHFAVGDRVATKPAATHGMPVVFGTIVDLVNGKVTVQWDNQQRSIFDMVEALWRIMEAPERQQQKVGMFVYSLPGMDNETVLMLSAAGVDPVSLYSLASHHKPSSETAKGGLANMVESMSTLGLQGKIITGFVSSDNAEEAFSRKDWIEAKLATGARLVVDLGSEQILIKAGSADDYIIPVNEPRIFIE